MAPNKVLATEIVGVFETSTDTGPKGFNPMFEAAEADIVGVFGVSAAGGVESLENTEAAAASGVFAETRVTEGVDDATETAGAVAIFEAILCSAVEALYIGDWKEKFALPPIAAEV